MLIHTSKSNPVNLVKSKRQIESKMNSTPHPRPFAVMQRSSPLTRWRWVSRTSTQPSWWALCPGRRAWRERTCWRPMCPSSRRRELPWISTPRRQSRWLLNFSWIFGRERVWHQWACSRLWGRETHDSQPLSNQHKEMKVLTQLFLSPDKHLSLNKGLSYFVFAMRPLI